MAKKSKNNGKRRVKTKTSKLSSRSKKVSKSRSKQKYAEVKEEIRKNIQRRSRNDLQIPLILLIMTMLVFFALTNSIKDKQLLLIEKDVLLSQITINPSASLHLDKETAFIIGDRVDKERLKMFAQKDYEEIKEQLGLKSDFSIYFTDGSEKIIPLDVGSEKKYCIGDKRTRVNGHSCS